ncbi:MAG: hypothetical protein KDI15_11825 [Thiothrix sp.]|nr:hypothetical protein [Thiothrix sp.]HPE58875.1 hypothetical protein [Thiolinea sp.]
MKIRYLTPVLWLSALLLQGCTPLQAESPPQWCFNGQPVSPADSRATLSACRGGTPSPPVARPKPGRYPAKADFSRRAAVIRYYRH